MSGAILVLNAGSSSLKFSLFAARDGALDLVVRGQAEGLTTSPRFVAKDAAGAVLDEKAWGDGAAVGHAGALDHLVGFLRQRLAGQRLAGQRRLRPGPSRGRNRVRRGSRGAAHPFARGRRQVRLDIAGRPAHSDV